MPGHRSETASRRADTERTERTELTELTALRARVAALESEDEERRWAVDILRLQREVLEGIALGQGLPDILDTMCRLIEQMVPGTAASILLLEQRSGTLRFLAGPSLSAQQIAILDGLVPRERGGSCGAAAFTGRTVIACDTSTDESWSDAREVASALGIGACWSIPVRAEGGRVLGSFAISHPAPKSPGDQHLALLDTASHLIGIAVRRDVAQRAEAELRDSERRIRALVEANPDMMFRIDRDGYFHDFRVANASDLLVPPDRLIGTNVRDVPFPPGVIEQVLEAIRTALETAEIQRLEYSLPADGGPHHYESRLAASGPDEVISIVRDITDRKRAEAESQRLQEELRHSQKLEAVGRLAGGVAHDFNNILTAILGNTELLQRMLARHGDRFPLDEAAVGLQQIKTAGERAASLIRQLLAFSRRQVIAPQVLDPNRVVAGVKEFLEHAVGEHIELQIELAPDVARIRADAGQIEQVLVNLALNARDAMPRGGILRIETGNVVLDDDYVRLHPNASTGPHVMLAVRDTGRGMSPEVLDRAFEPFFTTKPVGKGTGLGLAMVYGIATQVGGHVSVESNVGAGSTFQAFLPAADDQAPAGRVQPSSREAAGDEVVLVCEDDPEVRAVICQALRACGYSVVEADCAERALRLVEESDRDIDLLITDVVMPGMNGRVLAADLTGRSPGLRVLFVSGYSSDVIDLHGAELLGQSFLLKPFSPDLLLERVREILAR